MPAPGGHQDHVAQHMYMMCLTQCLGAEWLVSLSSVPYSLGCSFLSRSSRAAGSPGEAWEAWAQCESGLHTGQTQSVRTRAPVPCRDEPTVDGLQLAVCGGAGESP